MTKSTTKIPISSIIFEEDIYPRKGIDHKRVGIFAENIRDGFKFEPIEVEPYPDRPGKYRLLDGVHRWSAYKTVGMMEPEAIIKDLKGTEPMVWSLALKDKEDLERFKELGWGILIAKKYYYSFLI